ncbi:MAG TPA: HAD-IG family 5'-nucleotidase, partial [Polyangiaceae bacterium]|nr:HAD-IG family 5'-nucleotidase [Polyangiaceae bacterium]
MTDPLAPRATDTSLALATPRLPAAREAAKNGADFRRTVADQAAPPRNDESSVSNPAASDLAASDVPDSDPGLDAANIARANPTGAPEQLWLPLAHVVGPPPLALRIEPNERVFVNRDLNLANIDWLGFDMDYTLAVYNQQALDELSVQLTVDRMVARGYPRSLRQIRYDTRFPIRGLLVDKRFGNVLKMDRFKAVYKGYHGLARIKPAELHELYFEKQVRPNTPRYHWIDTLFSLSEVTSYAAIVDALDRHAGRVDYGTVFEDVRKSIDEAHRDGDFYASVTRDLSRYVQRDEHLEATLHKFRSAGKKLFLLTNSPWSYTDTMMSHLLDSRRKEYPTWRHYFDVVV